MAPMTKRWMFLVVLAFAGLLGGCGDDGAKPMPDACSGLACGGGSSAKELTSFAFLDSTNPALTADVIATINGNSVTATVPAGTDVTALVATFSTTGRTLTVGGVVQESGVATRNFTTPVSYVVTAEDGTTAAFTVTVTVAASSAKDITAFSFTDAANTALTADVTATVSGTSIAATVPAGTNVTALVATFATSGANVKIALTTQASGITANDFTNPVLYVVTAADNTTKMYTVTVSIAASNAKDITAFSFLDVTNPALSADVTATFNGTAIAATVPAGTNVTALVATFTSTGTGVAIGGFPQVTGSSTNDFTSPVQYTVTAADNSTKIYTVTVTVAPSTAKAITAFSFLDAPNAALSADVPGGINGLAITATVPAGTNVTALIATFTTTGASVKVGATTQASAITPNDFTNPVMYVVTAGDGSMQTYTVTVAIAASTAKDITAFSFLDTTNTALSADVTASINPGTHAITATVPAGTNLTALVASFTTNGTTVKVGATTQASGITANDFTSPVMYVVTAGDGSMQAYTVTVTAALSATKDITAFSFLDAANTALSADVTASIDQGTGAIAATVPAGTNVSALVASFTTTGASVRVGATTQVTGATANSFASPVMYVVTAADGSMKTYTVTVTVMAAATIPNGSYTWGTWICTRGVTVIDIKAFAMSLGIMEVQKTYAGGTGRVDVIYSASCTRTTQIPSITYPTMTSVQTITENMVTCTATCPGNQCTPGAQAVITDLFNFTLAPNQVNYSRTFQAGTITLQQAAGCMTGDIESGTDIKL
jgi:hypothetical protein